MFVSWYLQEAIDLVKPQLKKKAFRTKTIFMPIFTASFEITN